MRKKIIALERPNVPAKATISSGNVFADIGFSNADEMMAKAELVHEINARIRQRGLTQVEAAQLLGMHQPDLSLLSRGRLSRFSMERLFHYLRILNVAVEVHLVRNPPSKSAAPLRVMTAGD